MPRLLAAVGQISLVCRMPRLMQRALLVKSLVMLPYCGALHLKTISATIFYKCFAALPLEDVVVPKVLHLIRHLIRHLFQYYFNLFEFSIQVNSKSKK